MAIEGIHILYEVDTTRVDTQIREVQEAALVLAHRRGEHTYGKQLRACPLCK